jgi:Flp pilus assembly protein TadB
MARRAVLRASDSDREHIAERLRKATVEGRLLAEELEARLGAAFTARTYGELDALVADLPRERQPRSTRHRASRALSLAVAFTLILAVIGAIVLFITGLTVVFLWAAVCWWMFARRCRSHRSHRLSRDWHSGHQRLYRA